jgi:hypothetical protein
MTGEQIVLALSVSIVLTSWLSFLAVEDNDERIADEVDEVDDEEEAEDEGEANDLENEGDEDDDVELEEKGGNIRCAYITSKLYSWPY